MCRYVCLCMYMEYVYVQDSNTFICLHTSRSHSSPPSRPGCSAAIISSSSLTINSDLILAIYSRSSSGGLEVANDRRSVMRVRGGVGANLYG